MKKSFSKRGGSIAALCCTALLAGPAAWAQNETPPTDRGPENKPPIEVPIPSRATGSILGTVTADGALLPEAIVRIGSTLFNTGEDGAFSFQNVRTGTVAVVAHKRGYISASQRVSVTAETASTVELALKKIPAPQSGKGSVHGRVVTEDGGDPVENATVTAGGVSTQTDENGEFLLENLEPGETTVEVTLPEENTENTEGENEEEVVEVIPDVISEEIVEVDEDETETEEPAPVVPAGSLSGTVTDASGAGVEKALVRVSAGEDLVWLAKTDAEGNYSVEGVNAGAVNVVVIKGGYGHVELEATVTENADTDLDVVLTSREQKAPANTGSGKISGTVYSDQTLEDGTPVALEGAVVMVRGVRVFTGADGYYEIAGLPAGNFNVQVWMDGFRHTHKKVKLDAEDPEATVDITLHTRTQPEEADQGGDVNVGDADSDGDVNVTDAVTTLRAALGLIPLSEMSKSRADVAPSKARGDFGDGEVNILDAVKLLRNAAGLDKVLP